MNDFFLANNWFDRVVHTPLETQGVLIGASSYQAL